MRPTLLLLAGLIVMVPGTGSSPVAFDGPQGRVEDGVVFMTCVQSPDQFEQSLVLLDPNTLLLSEASPALTGSRRAR
jgi:hypothetical protein